MAALERVHMGATRFTTLLTASVVGTYLVLALGATTATAGEAATPGPLAWVARGHYALAAAVWLLVAATAASAWRDERAAGVRAGLALATVGVPVQGVVGMAGRVEGFDGAWWGIGVGGVHLFGGVAAFAVLLVVLVRHLDATVAEGDATAENVPTGTGSRPPPTDASAPDGPADRLRAYLALTKPRLMWLLCLLALAGMALAAATGAAVDGVTVVATLAGGVLAVGAAGTFNHLFERERDRKMARTADRPVATAAVPPRRAAAFGLGLAAASMTLLWTVVTPLATLLTAAAIGYYAVVYTVLLKPTTRWNTAVGGGSGALPALIGWAAVTGGIGLPAVLLAGVVVLWTPAHFYNFAIAHREEYASADYPMLPVVAGVRATRRRTCYWLGATLVAAVALGVVAEFGALYAVTTAGAGGVFLGSLVRQYDRGTDAAALRTFYASNAYLGLLLAAVVAEAVVV